MLCSRAPLPSPCLALLSRFTMILHFFRTQILLQTSPLLPIFLPSKQTEQAVTQYFLCNQSLISLLTLRLGLLLQEVVKVSILLVVIDILLPLSLQTKLALLSSNCFMKLVAPLTFISMTKLEQTDMTTQESPEVSAANIQILHSPASTPSTRMDSYSAQQPMKIFHTLTLFTSLSCLW